MEESIARDDSVLYLYTVKMGNFPNVRKKKKKVIFMMKDEFCKQVEAVTGSTPLISDNDYELIEYVYNFYPTISETDGKKQIAMLFSVGGMALIHDMLSRSKRAHELENQIHKCMSELNSYKKELEDMKTLDYSLV